MYIFFKATKLPVPGNTKSVSLVRLEAPRAPAAPDVNYVLFQSQCAAECSTRHFTAGSPPHTHTPVCTVYIGQVKN